MFDRPSRDSFRRPRSQASPFIENPQCASCFFIFSKTAIILSAALLYHPVSSITVLQIDPFHIIVIHRVTVSPSEYISANRHLAFEPRERRSARGKKPKLDFTGRPRGRPGASKRLQHSKRKAFEERLAQKTKSRITRGKKNSFSVAMTTAHHDRFCAATT